MLMASAPDTISAEEFFDEFRRRLAAATSLSALVTSDSPHHAVPDRAPAWTNALLNLILDWGRERGFGTYPKGRVFKIDTRRNRLKGEYLVDACWYFPNDETTPWREAPDRYRSQKHGFVLCAESEWGSFDDMMDDFAKLTELKSPLKVFIGAVTNKSMQDQFLRVTEWCVTNHLWISTVEQYLIMLWRADASWPERKEFECKIIRVPAAP